MHANKVIPENFGCCPLMPIIRPFEMRKAALNLHGFLKYDVHDSIFYYLKRLAMQGREREIDTLSVRRPQPHTTNQ